MSTTTEPVVLAVAASGCDSALAYAVEQARMRGTGLHLVHVVRLPAAEAFAGDPGDVLQVAAAVLDATAERARKLGGSRLRITTQHVDEGPLVGGLVGCLDGASQVVLQHRRFSRARRLVSGSVVSSVAARSPVAVVSVPEGWSEAGRHGRVSVAVQDIHEAEPLLRTGLAEAMLREAQLTVVHAWWLHSGVVGVGDSFQSQHEAALRRELEPVVETLAADFPGVTTRVDVVMATAVEALLDAAEDSDLLVLGRRHHLLPLGTHLGPVARAALHGAACPVLIAPEVPADPHPVSSRRTGDYAFGTTY